MIRIENNAERRIFVDNDKKEVQDLKNIIIQEIKNIENSDFDYNRLEKFIYYQYADNISVLLYRKKTLKVLDQLEKDSDISYKLRKLFPLLRENIFLLIIGRFDKIKEFINNLSGETLLLINRKKNGDPARADGYIVYKEKFEKLYTDNLSKTNCSFKKPFFKLFKDINTCPYCNRNFINPINKDKDTEVNGANDNQSPDIEHFFPKSIYPFLSLSISNLLPSCAFCNKIKSNVDTYIKNCVSPYEIEEYDTRFTFVFDSTDADTRKIKLKQTGDIYNSEILHLDRLYNEIHSNYVNDMFTKLKKYPDINKNFLKKAFDLSEDVYKKEFCNYYKEEDFNKHPLSKMTKDLFIHVKNYGSD